MDYGSKDIPKDINQTWYIYLTWWLPNCRGARDHFLGGALFVISINFQTDRAFDVNYTEKNVLAKQIT